MQKFNQVITVEVSVDSIAQQLLGQFKEESAHKNLIVESIIGRALEQDKAMLSRIYNSLNGFDVQIDFEIGSIIKKNDMRAYSYISEGKDERVVIEECRIIDINKHANSTLKVEYVVIGPKGLYTIKVDTINHSDCTLISDSFGELKNYDKIGQLAWNKPEMA
jgi:hypothetical protein